MANRQFFLTKAGLADRTSRRCAAGLFVALMALVCGEIGVTSAQDDVPAPPKLPPAKSLDQQLLDDLDRELLEGLPGRKAKPRTGQPADSQDPTAEPEVDSDNPLAKIAGQMRAVEGRIAERDTSAETQELQKRIVGGLAALLEQAKKQGGQKKPGQGSGQGNDQAGSGGNPTAGPARDSTDRIERGRAEAAETADVQDVLRRMWGHLPDKVRDQMQSSLSEEFLPKYQRLIEEYYQRLAESPAGAP